MVEYGPEVAVEIMETVEIVVHLLVVLVVVTILLVHSIMKTNLEGTIQREKDVIPEMEQARLPVKEILILV